MNEGTIEVQKIYQGGQPSGGLQDRFEEQIINLFSATEESSAETELQTRIDLITKSFLEAKQISRDVDLESVVEKFADSKLPLFPTDIDSYIEDLATNVVADSIHVSSPRFIGHMTSSLPYFFQPLGKLMTAMNQNVVKVETAKAFSPYERQALAMMHRLIYGFGDDFYTQHTQNSESTLGMMVTGGTLANITAMWCYRNALLGAKDDFGGVENEGLAAALNFYGYQGAVIIGSSLMHYSFEKAAGLLGIGDRNLIKIPTDQNHRLNLAALRETITECRQRNLLIIALVGIAGTTDSGAIDPLLEMSAIAQEYNINFHVDAAWGGAVLFSEQNQHKLAGIELADSVTIDGHKQLYLPMGLGMVILRNPHLAKYIEKTARYTVRKESPDLGKRSLEGSRPGMSLFLQAALNIIGHKGYEFLIDSGIKKAQYLANEINRKPEFELLFKPEINILLYRYIPEPFRQKTAQGKLTTSDNQAINDFNELLQNAQRQAGNTFVSRTTLENTAYGAGVPIVALRVVLANPLTTEADIDAVLNDQIKTAAKLPVITFNEEVNDDNL
ncbi:putative pyridoxal-dependent aspartate 1-decarboxylase [Microcoleus sp. FACHB-831]|uniref:pyridoxal-dependent aspartate 1-decarboxylase PanP n=1 Tax=Microcoleus sp. FACHB-831 TaxID=2692827 RepID=UPI0016863644|nr:putative pyridoxal-dependent aspartate 1-decarboxylase [Microcoleus sp. FACHB-831]MBD1924289.1 putative pyridoxal-dependent aspartate 1-decarboxylase [Microcoleus sp. FACHB-831]